MCENKLIVKLSSKIQRHRKQHPKQARLPKQIRDIVLRSLDEGVSSNKLGRAIGMSGRGIRYWQKLAPRIKKSPTKKSRALKSSFKRQDAHKNKFNLNDLKPRELSIVDEPIGLSFSQAKSQDRVAGRASVLLCSGIRIELEMAALDSDFLFRLNQIGGA